MISQNIQKKITLIFISVFLTVACFSQTFTEQTGISLSSISTGSVVWGDYDNDGYLDILMTGYNGSTDISKIYRNNGDNTFTEQASISLTGVSSGSVAWGDYDNDGNLDILLTGASNGGKVSKIYRNNGDNTFTEQTGISLPGVMWSSVAWGDYDNDGDLDILLTGENGSTAISKIYRNDGNNNFTEQTGISLTGVNDGSVAWGDYDNDGDLDILLTGASNAGKVSKIYRNNGNNTFTEQTGISLTGVEYGAVAWGDYNNDGYLDILLTGGTGWYSSPIVSKIYRNNGNNTFTEQTGISLTGVSFGSVAWGDYDNDGDLDILISGSGITKIYCNNGNNTFTEQTGIPLTGVSLGSVAWGDYDNDGDLDVLLTGKNGSTRISKIYRNDGTVVNNIPDAPLGIEQSLNERDVILKWKPVTTNITPAKALSYNVRVGTTSAAINTNSPQASDSGLRRIVAMGNGQLDTVFYLKNLKKGTYYWSIQAINNRFEGGSFSTEGSFEVTANNPAYGLTVSKYEGSYAMLNWNRGNLAKCIVFIKEGTGSFSPINNTTYTASTSFGQGTYAGNGYYCVYNGVSDNVKITGLKGLTNYTIQVFEYDGTAGIEQYLTTNLTDNIKSFTTLLFTKQTGTSSASETIDMGDYDNDGDLDILLTITSNSLYLKGNTKIYRNNGDNTFTLQTATSLIGVYFGSAKWGDYNNDGYLDIIVSGVIHENKSYAPEVDTTLIYKNNGNGTFTAQTDIKLPPLVRSSVTWGDYDNDGYLDFILTGAVRDSYSISHVVSKIYRNNGDNSFSEQTGISLTGVSFGSVAWGDYDNDGYLDILICGSGISKIYRNNGNNTFTEQTGILLTGVSSGSVVWGDYDNDGYLDILLTGKDSNTLSISKIYRNNGNNTFTEQTGISLTGMNSGTASWDDFDNDGYLDILLIGYNGSTYISKIYLNNGNNTFTEQIGISFDKDYRSVACDYDNDGDLDIISGSKIYRNDITVIKAILNNAPINLNHIITPGSVKLTWDPSASIPNQGKGYSYNLRVIKKSDSLNVTPSHSAENGFRKVVATGNAQLNNSYILNNLKLGTYYWQVQAIDGANQGGAFSIIDSFVVDIPIQASKLSVSNIDGSSALLKWERGNSNKCVVFIKEGTGNLDLRNDSTYTASTIYKNGSATTTGWYCVYNGTGESVQITGLNGLANYIVEVVEYDGSAGSEQYLSTSSSENLLTFKSLNFSLQSVFPFNSGDASAWADYDNDGDLDVFISVITSNGTYISKIFRNNGNNTFTEQTGISLTGGCTSVAWGDYNNDGNLDILLIGYANNGCFTKIYRNNGDNTFTEQTSISLIKVLGGSIAWGDYDNDGYLDILLTGNPCSGTRISKIYHNNGDNSFSESNISLPGVENGSAVWGDSDNDGYLDILLAGNTGKGIISKIYHNNGDNTFTEQTGISLTGVYYCSVAWGDYNNDGYLDILLTGNPRYDVHTSKIYKNNGDNTFTEQTGISLIGVESGSVGWVDYDNDGYLDIMLKGKVYRNNGNNTFTIQNDIILPSNSGIWGDYDNDGDMDVITGNKLYKNYITSSQEQKTNRTPLSPKNLSSSIFGNEILLSWSGDTTDETPQNTLSYNIAIGKTKNSLLIGAPQSNDTIRKVVAMGNACLNNFYKLKLNNGKYYWQVQAIDGGFQGGSFSTIDSFIVKTPNQASGLNVSIINDSSALLTWNRGNLNNCVVFIKKGISSFVPTNNTTYIASTVYNSGSPIADDWYCVYNGTSNSVQITGLDRPANYIVEVFEYNGIDGSERYLPSISSENKLLFTIYSLNQSEIFPNPVHNVVYILNKNKNETPQLYIYTTNGKQLYNITLKDVLTEIDVSNYNNGIYIFKILHSDGFTTYKIIKK